MNNLLTGVISHLYDTIKQIEYENSIKISVLNELEIRALNKLENTPDFDILDEILKLKREITNQKANKTEEIDTLILWLQDKRSDDRLT